MQSTYVEWVVSLTDSHLLNAWRDRLAQANEDAAQIKKWRNEFDPNMELEYTGTRYKCYPIELEE